MCEYNLKKIKYLGPCHTEFIQDTHLWVFRVEFNSRVKRPPLTIRSKVRKSQTTSLSQGMPTLSLQG